MYDVLHKAELVYYLDTQPDAFDAVISADTLCYFGKLENVCAASRRSLRPGGLLVFTVEALLPPATMAGIEPRMGPVPALGEHTRTILTEIGLSASHIDRLAREGAI